MEEKATALQDIDILTGEPMLGEDAIEPLFVINLCAAMTPQDLDTRGITGLEHYKLYQVSRMEDGRRRYRLRLGFFTTEAAAEDILESVRKYYATAFTACLCDEDMKHASGYLKRSVQDLQRTGRFNMKPRAHAGSHSAATSDTTIIRNLRAVATAPIDKNAVENSFSASLTVSPIIAKPVIAKPVVANQPTAKPAIAKANLAAEFNTVVKQPSTAVTSLNRNGATNEEIVELTWEPKVAHAPAKNSTLPIVSAPDVDKSAATTTANTNVANGSRMRRAHELETEATARGERQLFANAKSITAKAAPVKPVAEKIVAAKVADSKPVTKAITATSPGVSPNMHVAATMKPAVKNVIATPAHAAIVKPAPPIASIKLEAVVPSASPPKPIQKSAQPFHVGAGIDIPDTELSLAAADAGPVSISVAIATIDAPASPVKAAPTISPITGAASNAAKESSHMADLMRARELAKQSTQWRQQHGEIPTLDTTQTIRTLTKNEIDDANCPKWFTVQLAVSEHPANLDTMPRLDIFEAYSLYSVAIMEGEHIRHALRLGFFREEVSAQAVLGYLKTFFNEPHIVRIADAEHDRFANSAAPKMSPPPQAVKPEATVVALDPKRPTKTNSANAMVPTVNAAVTRTSAMKPHAKTTATSRPMSRASTPATKSAGFSHANGTRKPPGANKAKSGNRVSQRDMIEEARLLGLSETAIQRVQKNPSLLSRLVGKLTK